MKIAYIKILETNSVGQNVVRKEISFTVVEHVALFNIYGKQNEQFSQFPPSQIIS